MKKMFLSLAVAACFLVPQTVYAEWDWWGMAKPQQKKEAKKELKQDRKELKDINKQERKDLKAGNRLEAATMNPEMVKALKDKTDAFQKKQQQMSKELQESMKGMNEEQRAKALADYREKQYQSSAEFSRAMHEENVKSLKERLDKNPNMTGRRRRRSSPIWKSNIRT